MAQTTRSDHIATLSAVVSERRRKLAESERQLADAQSRDRSVSVWQASVELDRSILAGVERAMAKAQEAAARTGLDRFVVTMTNGNIVTLSARTPEGACQRAERVCGSPAATAALQVCAPHWTGCHHFGAAAATCPVHGATPEVSQ
jgi:hypothetical protein